MKVRLGDVCEILNGFAFKSENYVSDGIRIIRIANVQKGYIEDSLPCFYPLEQKNNLRRYMLNEGDLLLSLTGNVGRVALLHKEMLPAALNQRVACLRIKSDDVLKKYLFYVLDSDKFEQECIESAKGIAQKNMSTEWLKEYILNIPTIETQHKETRVLDKIGSLIEKCKHQLEKLDSLVKSKFIAMFGEINKPKYPLQSINDLCVFVKDGTHQTPCYTNDKINGYKFLSSKSVTGGVIDWDNIMYIPQELHEELYASISPQRNDILLAKNGTTGIAALVDTDEVFDIYVSLALLRFKEGINIKYVLYAINSKGTKKQFDESLKGIGVPNLHLGEIKKTKLIVPPLELQNEFSKFAEKVESMKKLILQSLEKLETLKKALMQKYFG